MNLHNLRVWTTLTATVLLLSGCASVPDKVEGAGAPPPGGMALQSSTPSDSAYEVDYMSDWSDGTILAGDYPQVDQQSLLQTGDSMDAQNYWTVFPYKKGCYVIIQSDEPDVDSVDRVIIKYRFGNEGETLIDDSSGLYDLENLWTLLASAMECQDEPPASKT